MNYKIDKSEVLRYLGIKGGSDPQTDLLIDECATNLCSVVRPKYIHQSFDLIHDSDAIYLACCDMRLSGRTARDRLSGCHCCYMLAATLGHEADVLIRRAQFTDMTRAIIYDACATDLIEKVCDHAESEISSIAAANSCFARERFSAGYGDLPLSLQRDVCRLLGTDRKIGVSLTDKLMLLPTKSVTAFIGICTEENPDDFSCKNTCNNCSMRDSCSYRK